MAWGLIWQVFHELGACGNIVYQQDYFVWHPQSRKKETAARNVWKEVKQPDWTGQVHLQIQKSHHSCNLDGQPNCKYSVLSKNAIWKRDPLSKTTKTIKSNPLNVSQRSRIFLSYLIVPLSTVVSLGYNHQIKKADVQSFSALNSPNLSLATFVPKKGLNHQLDLWRDIFLVHSHPTVKEKPTKEDVSFLLLKKIKTKKDLLFLRRLLCRTLVCIFLPYLLQAAVMPHNSFV